MSIIKITDDNNKIYTYTLSGYSISHLENALLLEIVLPNAILKYEIHSDTREPHITKIESFILNQFDDALKNNKTIYLNEFLVRSYIFIGMDPETRRQFTAKKYKI